MVTWVVLQIHFTTTSEFIHTENQEQWIKIDAQLRSVIKSTMHTSLKLNFHTHALIKLLGLSINPTMRWIVISQEKLESGDIITTSINCNEQ